MIARETLSPGLAFLLEMAFTDKLGVKLLGFDATFQANVPLYS
jgi:hypothetical protein